MRVVAFCLFFIVPALGGCDSVSPGLCPDGTWSPITGICTTTTRGDLHDAATFVDSVALSLGGDFRGIAVHLVHDPGPLAAFTGGHCVGGLTSFERGETWATPGSLAHELTHWAIFRAGRYVEPAPGASWDELTEHVHSAAGGWFPEDEARARWANRSKPVTPFSAWGSSCRR